MAIKCRVCGNVYTNEYFNDKLGNICKFCSKTIWGNPAATPQPMPEGQGQEVLEEVIKDLRDRSREGVRKYGTPLRINNGRDALLDAYQEALDLCQYLKQAIMERDKNE